MRCGCWIHGLGRGQVAAIGSALLMGCSVIGLDDSACSTELRFSVAIEVRDSLTNAPAATGAAGTITDGDYSYAFRPYGDGVLMFAGESRAGTYVVTVEKPGYRTWQVSNVLVRVDRCGHARTAIFQVRLQPGE